MQQYRYEAIDLSGQRQTGTLVAGGPSVVQAMLRRSGLYVVRIQSPTQNSGHTRLLPQLRRRLPISMRDRIGFLKSLSLGLESGTPLLEALGRCREESRHPRLAGNIARLQRSVESGLPLSRAFTATGHCCGVVTTRLVEAAESSGQLHQCLNRAAASLERRAQMKQRLVSAAVYPALTALLTMVVATALVLFVLPTMQEVFEERQLQLPRSATLLLEAGTTLRDHALQIAACCATVAVLAFAAWRDRETRRQLDALILRLPVIGPVVAARMFGQVADVLGLLLDNHVRLSDALRTVSTLSSNRAVSDSLLRARRQMVHGRMPGEILEQSPVVPVSFAHAVRVGERTGTLAESLRSAATHFEHQFHVRTRALTSILEPALVIVVGSVLGFLFYTAYEAMTQFALSTVPGP